MLVARVRVQSKASDRRWDVRRPVDLDVTATREQDDYPVTIQNLSENGVLFETDEAVLAVGDNFEIDLPELGRCAAEVVWAHRKLRGCRFFVPISKAAVSAAVLQSPFIGNTADADPYTARPSWLPDDVVVQPPATGWAVVALSLLLILVFVFIYALLALPITF